MYLENWIEEKQGNREGCIFGRGCGAKVSKVENFKKGKYNFVEENFC